MRWRERCVTQSASPSHRGLSPCSLPLVSALLGREVRGGSGSGLDAVAPCQVLQRCLHLARCVRPCVARENARPASATATGASGRAARPDPDPPRTAHEPRATPRGQATPQPSNPAILGDHHKRLPTDEPPRVNPRPTGRRAPPNRPQRAGRPHPECHRQARPAVAGTAVVHSVSPRPSTGRPRSDLRGQVCGFRPGFFVAFPTHGLCRLSPDREISGVAPDLAGLRGSIPYPQPLRLRMNLKII